MKEFFKKYKWILIACVAIGFFVSWFLAAALFLCVFIFYKGTDESEEDIEVDEEIIFTVDENDTIFSTEDAPPVPVLVRIKSCDSPFAWYYERCGEIFAVLEYDEEMYITIDRDPQSHIRKVDCDIIGDFHKGYDKQ
jgi:hypothetical protein